MNEGESKGHVLIADIARGNDSATARYQVGKNTYLPTKALALALPPALARAD